MSDTIEDIRARHATTTLRSDGSHAAFHAHYDRGTLLAEVDRLTRERDEARGKEMYYHEGFEEGSKTAQWEAAENARLRAVLRDVAEELEDEEPRSHKKIAFSIRAALEAKP